MHYTVAKARGLWWVLDVEGYEVSYVGHDTKAAATAAAKVRGYEDFDERAAMKTLASK